MSPKKKNDTKKGEVSKKSSESRKKRDSEEHRASPKDRPAVSESSAPPAPRLPSGRGRPGAPLTPDQLSELLELLPSSDSIELKVTIPEESQRSTVTVLGMDPLKAQIRQVYFYDTPDLALYQAGVVARARRIQGRGADSVVKLRPIVPDAISSDLRASSAFVVEIDAMPGGFVCSGTLKSRVDQEAVRQVATGGLPLRKLFDKQQRKLFQEHAPKELQLDQLSILGPIFVLKLPFTSSEFHRRLVAEMWLYPDGSRILELSTKCRPAESLTVFAEARRFLDDRGIDRSGDQQAKTRRALRFFAKELTAGRNEQVRESATA